MCVGDEYTITHGKSCHILADFLYDASKFVSKYMWQLKIEADPVPVTHPEMPIASADSVCLHFDVTAAQMHPGVGASTSRISNGLASSVSTSAFMFFLPEMKV